ncbi:snoRNA-binding rRNA-processing protein utp10 [Coemansia thaxteri]|nr:snoRNA-binding rRNA-processing protein utp10 [Coemansia thaxteri]KAJ2468507.1 snoRNA-binding rRNA-processing protein utp10 [Coemansia sp. RSA 2322]
MASSLASQLYKMRTLDRVVGNERSHNVKASFLFDGRQAADLDNQTIFDIGREGLSELRRINRRFDGYASTLFSEAVKDMDRVLQTKEENDKLDESIRSFLFLLAPHFLTKPAGKAIEWLVRRFRIQEFNVKDVLAAMFPYHETKAFLTMLTILTFDAADMGLFGFLTLQRKARRLLDRATLMAQCERDRSLMAFICNSVFSAIRAGLDYPGLHSFYAVMMSQYIGQLATIDNSGIQFVLPYVLDGLNIDSKDAQTASYMVLGSLATRVTLTEDALEKTLCAVAQRPADVRTMAMCLVQLMQTQVSAVDSLLPSRFLRILAGHSGFPRTVCDLAASFDIELFMRPLLNSLMHHAFADPLQSQFLSSLVSVLPVSYAPMLCERFVYEYLAQRQGKASGEIVNVFQLRYSQQMEDAIGAAASQLGLARDMSEVDREAAHRKLYELKMHGGAGQTSGASGVLLVKETATTLYLSMNHADAGIRLVAAKALRDIVSGARPGNFELPREDASSLIVERLLQDDDSNEVLEVILSMPLSTLVSAHELIPALVSVVESGRMAVLSKACTAGVFGNLLAIDVSSDKQLYEQVVAAVFPYLMKSLGSEHVTDALFSQLPGSAFGQQQNQQLGGWLSCLASGDHASCFGAKVAGGKFNKNVAKRLAARLVEQWDDRQSAGVWEAQLASGKRQAQIAAIVIGAHAVELLGKKGKSTEKCVAAGTLVGKAAMSLLLLTEKEACGEEMLVRQSKEVSEDVLLASISSSGTQWESLLGELATGQHALRTVRIKIAMGALSTTLTTLSAAVMLQGNKWFGQEANGDDVETRYRSFLRAVFEGLVSRAGKLSSADGVLIGRVLSVGMGESWAQFLASVWLSSSGSAGPVARARSLITFQALLLRHKAAQHEAESESPPLVDYQTVLPSVVVMLSDEDARVRGAAVACVKALNALYSEASGGSSADKSKKKKKGKRSGSSADSSADIYLYDEIYGAGASERLQYLGTETAGAFVAMLAAGVDAMAGDAWAVRSELGQILNRGVSSTGGKGRKLSSQERSSVVAYLLSHVVALDGVAAEVQIRLLAVLELVASDGVLAQLFPLIREHSERLRSAAGAGAVPAENGATDRVVRALFRACYSEATGRQLSEGSGREYWEAFLALVGGVDSAAAAGAAFGEWSGAARASAYLQQVALERVDAGLVAALGPGAAARAVTQRLMRAATRGTAYQATGVRCVALRHVFARVALDLDAVAEEIGAIAARVAAGEGEGADVGEVATLLEYLLGADVGAAQGAVLAAGLFALLAALAGGGGGSGDQAARDHGKQLAMALLTRVCGAAAVGEGSVRVDVIVQTLRTSRSPQTHNRALQLLAAVAAQHPAAVLHHVMAVFTFMGANAARVDDAYSFHVLTQTLEAVVAAVVPAGGAGAVLRVFVDSLSHVPRHRRVALFATLVATLGADASLPEAVAQLLEKSAARDDVEAFALTLTHEFAAAQQIGAAAALVRNQISGGQIGRQLPAALGFARRLLASAQLEARLRRERANGSADADAGVDAAAAAAAQAALEAVAALDAHDASGALQAAALGVVDGATALLGHRAFASSAAALLRHGDARVRLRAVALVDARVGAARDAADDLLALVEPVAALAGAAREDAACRRAALLCVAAAARRYARIRPAEFEAPAVVRAVADGLQTGGVADAALAAVAVLCGELGARLTASLPELLPRVLLLLRTDAAADPALAAAALAAMRAVVEAMPAFLAPSLPAVLAAVIAGIKGRAEITDDVVARADDLLAALARHIPPRHLLPALFAFHHREAARMGCRAAVALVAFVGRAAGALQRAPLLQFYKPLFKFFLSVFDAARDSAVPQHDADALEQAALDAFLRFVVKLNESLFRPLFLSFLEWATADAPALATGDAWRVQCAAETRLRVFYCTLNALLDRLRAIVVPYYAHVIDTTVAVLIRFGVAHATIEMQEESDRCVKPPPSPLWCAVVESVRLSALHDASASAASVWSDEAFRKVYRPLAYQLANTKPAAADAASSSSHDAAYLDRIRRFLAPAASQLAAAVSNDALWKLLNQEVMLKSRSDLPSVRIAALLVLQALYDRLGEEFLILLPESISYLAELLEDDSPHVERATQETVAIIESHLGESLQTYLR